MKHLILSATTVCMFCCFALQARKENDKVEKKQTEYEFTDLKILPHTSVKNQASSGTCWSFSGLSMLESEIMRIGGDSVNLSPMWVVRNIYRDKTVKYVRMHGKLNLSAGGSFADVIHAFESYGAFPESLYAGLNYGTDTHRHGELDKIVKGLGDAVVQNKKPTAAWTRALDGVLDAYLGKAPEKFEYKGREYTPQSFAQSFGLNTDDYVSLTSFTHAPFYRPFVLEIPDNWIFESSYNLPMDELIAVIDNALNSGYTVAWGADVSESGFSRDVATVPQKKKVEEIGSDQAKWTKEKQKTLEPLPEEVTVTQEMRQLSFDNYETTDDHGMQIVGFAKDQTGKHFYKVKNSWGAGGKYKGYLYASRAFVQYKTMNIVVNRNAIPANVKTKISF
ncbi:MAG: aminopeptidase [Prevotellaceae bacterium]|jgi:aminopeptidase C|nr:aminopeptidase [Prevotellaceae bacterium]